MKDNGTLYYLHGDHLGSTSLTTNTSGAVVSVNSYTPFGTSRYSNGTRPTAKDFTGQLLDGTGLHFYNARYYDSLIGRFISADTIVPEPGGSQGFNRYAYVNNNPVRYTDPTGHFSEDVIQNYLNTYYGDSVGSDLFKEWKSDNEWWAMLRDAISGDVLYGAGGGRGFQYQFIGSSDNKYLFGIARIDSQPEQYTLVDIRRGFGLTEYNNGSVYHPDIKWFGTYRLTQDNVEFRNSRFPVVMQQPSGIDRNLTATGSLVITTGAGAAVGTAMEPVGGTVAGAVTGFVIGVVDIWFMSGQIYDALDQEPGDMHVQIGPAYFNLQRPDPYSSTTYLEYYEYRPR
jgi:RHS repeat-associated protein